MVWRRLGLLLVLLLEPLPGVAQPPAGVWVVVEATQVENRDVELVGDVIVLEGGLLNLSSSRLTLVTTAGNDRFLQINGGGTVVFWGATTPAGLLRKQSIPPASPDLDFGIRIAIDANGVFYGRQCVIDGTSLNQNYGGVILAFNDAFVNRGQLQLEDCSLTSAMRGIHAIHGDTRISNVSIEAPDDLALDVEGGQIHVENLTAKGMVSVENAALARFDHASIRVDTEGLSALVLNDLDSFGGETTTLQGSVLGACLRTLNASAILVDTQFLDCSYGFVIRNSNVAVLGADFRGVGRQAENAWLVEDSSLLMINAGLPNDVAPMMVRGQSQVDLVNVSFEREPIVEGAGKVDSFGTVDVVIKGTSICPDVLTLVSDSGVEVTAPMAANCTYGARLPYLSISNEGSKILAAEWNVTFLDASKKFPAGPGHSQVLMDAEETVTPTSPPGSRGHQTNLELALPTLLAVIALAIAKRRLH